MRWYQSLFSRKRKQYVLWILIILYISIILVTWYLYPYAKDEEGRRRATIIICLSIGIIMALFLYLSQLESLSSEFNVEIEQLRVERTEITKKIEDEEGEPDIFYTIQLSLNQLNEYYTINKAQATTSFRFSIAAIVVGLCFILAGITLNYTGTKTIEITYLAGISGILLEFIGGAYFFMYKKSLEQVNFFFGQLIKVQDTMLAINLADAIKEDGKKIDMQEKIIVSLLERSLK